MNTFTFTVPTDKMECQWHACYARAYSRLLASLMDTTDSVLEIGTAGGGSLIAYRDWFPNAKVFGIDPFFQPDLPPTICHYKRDAYCQDGVTLMKGHAPFAVIVDDGPHSIESQEFFVRHYPQMLSRDGVAICEDVQSPAHIDRLFKALPDGFTGYSIDMRLADNRYDSLIFVVERK